MPGDDLGEPRLERLQPVAEPDVVVETTTAQLPQTAEPVGANETPLASESIVEATPGVQYAPRLGRLLMVPPLEPMEPRRDSRMLEFRVGMLLAFAEQRPSRCCRREPSALLPALVLLCLALLSPHHASTAALDVLHTGAEHAVSVLFP